MIGDIDGHDPQAIEQAIREAQSVKDKPSLIICRTVIGFGSPIKPAPKRRTARRSGKKRSP
ncbi:Transketolase 2 [Raoultella terrigena]|uniref:Transketolase 2 n=1 Tax=Raoultella terrigena TaxID=577 RepID=A0A4U9D4Q9_RAOTE|nr:Transketolase 2 [Raoultella terrigena]